MKKSLVGLTLAGSLLILALVANGQLGGRTYPQEVAVATKGSATVVRRHDFGAIKVYEVSWTSDASGMVSARLPLLYGVLLRASAVPSKTAAPTSGYGVVLSDEDGVDLLSGKGYGLTDTVSVTFAPFVGDGTFDVPMTIGGEPSLTVSGAGPLRSGKLVLYVRS